jgi:hypothetical protein
MDENLEQSVEQEHSNMRTSVKESVIIVFGKRLTIIQKNLRED